MKLGSLTKFGKRSTATPKRIDDYVMPTKCDVIVNFPIYDQFGAIRKPDFGRMA